MKKAAIKNFITSEELDRLAERIKLAESGTRGALRLSVVMKRSLMELRLSPAQLALKEFRRLKMDRTKDRTGILLLVLPKERVFHILADEGINSRLEGKPWEGIAEGLSERFSQGKYAEGLGGAIDEIGDILHQHVPQRPGDTNELPDKVEIRE